MAPPPPTPPCCGAELGCVWLGCALLSARWVAALAQPRGCEGADFGAFLLAGFGAGTGTGFLNIRLLILQLQLSLLLIILRILRFSLPRLLLFPLHPRLLQLPPRRMHSEEGVLCGVHSPYARSPTFTPTPTPNSTPTPSTPLPTLPPAAALYPLPRRRFLVMRGAWSLLLHFCTHTPIPPKHAILLLLPRSLLLLLLPVLLLFRLLPLSPRRMRREEVCAGRIAHPCGVRACESGCAGGGESG